MDVTFDFSDVDSFFQEAESEVMSKMKSVGEESVDYAKQNGTYRNRTGRLRRSNAYSADASGMTLYNNTPYAGSVEQRGYDVLSGAALFAEKRLKEEFEQ